MPDMPGQRAGPRSRVHLRRERPYLRVCGLPGVQGGWSVALTEVVSLTEGA
jgi:hypothetical protein